MIHIIINKNNNNSDDDDDDDDDINNNNNNNNNNNKNNYYKKEKKRKEWDESVYLFHGLGLGSRPHSAHRQTHIDSRTDTFVKQLCLQEDLTISDGNHIGWNICWHITCLLVQHKQK